MIQIKLQINKGKLSSESRLILDDSLAPLDGLFHFKVWRYRPERTTPQNAYYWGVVIRTAAKELGYTEQELHDTFKAMFLIDRSQKLPVVRSTTSLDTVQFMEYLDNCIRVCAELNIILPEPECYVI
jgi:hypothetical protein